MAQRRMKRRFRRVARDKAWFVDSASWTFTFADSTNNRSGYETVMTFGDIDTDEALVAKERSRWLIERVIFWFSRQWAPVNLSSALGSPMGGFALVQADLNEETSASGFTSKTLDDPDWTNGMARVYMYDWKSVWQKRVLTFDGGDLVANGTTSDGAGYNEPRNVEKWDLKNLRTRLSDTTELGFAHSFLTNGVVAGDGMGGFWVAKVLLSRQTG